MVAGTSSNLRSRYKNGWHCHPPTMQPGAQYITTLDISCPYAKWQAYCPSVRFTAKSMCEVLTKCLACSEKLHTW